MLEDVVAEMRARSALLEGGGEDGFFFAASPVILRERLGEGAAILRSEAPDRFGRCFT
jgi:hypothetical protein